MKDGTKYEGDFNNGEITVLFISVLSSQGKGVKTWPDGAVYSGEFLGGEQHGEGEMKYANGEIYIGSWQYNARSGKKGGKTATREREIDEKEWRSGGGNRDDLHDLGRI